MLDTAFMARAMEVRARMEAATRKSEEERVARREELAKAGIGADALAAWQAEHLAALQADELGRPSAATDASDTEETKAAPGP